MKNYRRSISTLFLSLLLVFNLCSTSAYGMAPSNSYDRIESASYSRAATTSTIKLNKTNYTLVKGQTVTLSLSGTKNKVTWHSSNTKVATVSSNGKVTAKAKGNATITAKVNTKKYTCKIKVETPKINYSSLSLNKGTSKSLKITGTTQKITWSSSNKSIATVSSSGVISTKKSGTATITGKLSSGKKYTCKITVKKQVTAESTVYITKTGHKYHRGSCRYLRKSKIAISLKDAKRRGYTACSVCY